MRKILCIVTVFSVMVSLLVFPSSAVEDPVPDVPVPELTEPELTEPELVAHGIRSQRMQDYVDSVERGSRSEYRHTMTGAFREIFTDLLPAMAAVALWVSDRIQADLIVYLMALALLYYIVGGKRRVREN